MIPAPRPRWAGPLLLLAALLAYAAVLGGSFQFDDFNVIVDEPGVHSLGAWAAGLGGIRPLLKLSYALNWTLHPGATGFLATNLAIHLAASWMVHRLLLWIFAAAGMEEARQAPAAFLGALIFALHPAQVEAVAYVTGRSASLSAALMLASALAYLRGREGRAWTLGSVALFLLALAAKETALILPALLILLELARPKGERRPFRGPLLHWAFALGGVALLATLPFYHRLAAFSFALRSPGAQARAALVGLGYLGRVLLWPARLNIDPPLRTPEAWSAGLLMLAAAWVLMALLGVLALRGRRRWLGVGLLWMLLALLPTQGPMARLDLASERHLYLAIRHQAALNEARPGDAIVVFGAAQYNGVPSPVLQARLDHAFDLEEQGLAPLPRWQGPPERRGLSAAGPDGRAYRRLDHVHEHRSGRGRCVSRRAG